MTMLYLIVEAGGSRLAVPAIDIHTVMTCENIVPVPHVAPYVAGLAAMRSEVITVIDPIAAIRGGDPVFAREATLVAITIEGHIYGLIVDDVLDAVEIEEAPRPADVSMDPGWRAVATGMIAVDGQPVMAIDPEALVAGPQRRAA